MHVDARATRCETHRNQAHVGRQYSVRTAAIVSHPGGIFRLGCELSYFMRSTDRPPRF
ncbi:hypothetical protein XOC_0145 [Xanthomonas oryzae pv. oryzicola BLS256]|uniref:Uncharacterized protein n=1 Tax=Xanthomonas oryzae pv. oryzicola (strain BLS256) TaxID=383407 RepID=G7TIV6_XANOB|nr:hypothetical protein XOC_0145 [Xanthomonas oryzae pv. oryzicola BLS256]QEO99837.1 hypothetical protein XOCgx_4850 [Xanthomonas oryzae pv. oryzicola]